MAIYKRGKIYWYKFMWNGELIRESTKQGNHNTARNMESAHRASLANGLVGIREKKQAPTLAEFLEKDFLPYVETHFASKPKTAAYYAYGAALLKEAEMGSLRLDVITSQNAVGFIAKKSKLSPSTVNCGLRTLRRALNLADEWGKIERAPKLTLAKGERQRDRIVTEPEFIAYRELCRQPWRDVATILYGTGMRPGEAYAMRWEHVLLNGKGGLIQIADGKTKAARRFLPMVPEVYSTLKSRWEDQKQPTEGWVFPSASRSGHLEESSAKITHGTACRTLAAASVAFKAWRKNGTSGKWEDAVTATTKLEGRYLEKHGAVIRSGFTALNLTVSATAH